MAMLVTGYKDAVANVKLIIGDVRDEKFLWKVFEE